MTHLFNNIYRIPSARLQNWNYANEGMYFVTICTENRENYFGKLVDALLQPTEIGKIAHLEWYKSVELRTDMNLELGEFVVMPNHIHGIIIIGPNEFNSQRDAQWDAQRDTQRDTQRRDAMHCVSTPTTPTTPEYKNQFAPQSKNLSSIIRGYKSAVTTYARKNGIVFGWQPRFHDHIIRSMGEYHNIANYIINNPAKWQEDKFYAGR